MTRTTDTLAQGLRVMALLREEPRTPGWLAEHLGVGRRTVDRILRTLEAAGEPLTVRREGREAWYSLGR